MTTGNDDWLLDRVLFDSMPPELYARVHPATVGDPPGAIDPMRANPDSRARFALGPHLVPIAPKCGMVYLSTTPAGALFETLLRRADWYSQQRLGLPAHRLAGWRLSFLRLKRSLQVIPVGLPDRQRIVDPDSWRDARWRELISVADHGDTHAAAAAVYDQVVAGGHAHTGLTWGSVQLPGTKIYLLYQPPFDPADWIWAGTFDLDTPNGQQLIANWLAAAGYTWVGDPATGVTPISVVL